MQAIIHDPCNKETIDNLYAFISVDENGNEGILGASLPPGQVLPLVFSDMSLSDKMRDIAKGIAVHTDKTIKLVKFSNKEYVEDITP